MEPNDKLQPPRTLSQLKSFLGSVYSLQKYLRVIAETSAPLRSLLSKKNDCVGSTDCQFAFENLKIQVGSIVEIKPFYVNKDIHIECDASQNGQFLKNWAPSAGGRSRLHQDN